MVENMNSPGSRTPELQSTPQSPTVPRPEDFYVFKLYISGASERSQRAVSNIKRLCEQNLAGRYQLEVVDLFQEPNLDTSDVIDAVPTLVKRLPLPLRRVIGDLSNTEEILIRLELISGGRRSP
jgi:circadian clock protein KaiB